MGMTPGKLAKSDSMTRHRVGKIELDGALLCPRITPTSVRFRWSWSGIGVPDRPMVLVQRKRRRWGAFITLDGPALIAPIKADQQSAWRQLRTRGPCQRGDIDLHGKADSRRRPELATFAQRYL